MAGLPTPNFPWNSDLSETSKENKVCVFFFRKLRSSRFKPPILALVDNPNLAEKQRPAQEDEIQRPTQSSGPTPELTP